MAKHGRRSVGGQGTFPLLFEVEGMPCVLSPLLFWGKIVSTRCQILRLKCTKFNFGLGSAPESAGGAYSAPPAPLAGFKGPTSKGREERNEGRGPRYFFLRI